MPPPLCPHCSAEMRCHAEGLHALCDWRCAECGPAICADRYAVMAEVRMCIEVVSKMVASRAVAAAGFRTDGRMVEAAVMDAERRLLQDVAARIEAERGKPC